MITLEEMLKNMTSSYNGTDKMADMSEVMMTMDWLSHIVGGKCENYDMGKKSLTMADVLSGVSSGIKYSFMESGMTKWDGYFKSMVEMSIKGDEDDNMLKAVYEVVKETMEEYGIRKRDAELMPLVIKHFVEMADSTQMIEYYFAKVVKTKIDGMLEMAGMGDSKMQQEKDEKDRKEMMEWMKKEIAMEIKKTMPNDTKMPITMEKGMEWLEMSMDAHKMRKKAVCSEMYEAHKCLESKLHLVHEESKPVVMATVDAMMEITKYMCKRKYWWKHYWGWLLKNLQYKMLCLVKFNTRHGYG